jgi:hypothetical protein
VRKYDKTERNHPETENGQKTQRSANHQSGAGGDPANPRTRHGKAPFSDMEATRLVVHSEFHSILPFSVWPVDNFLNVDKPGKSGLQRDKTRGMRFF